MISNLKIQVKEDKRIEEALKEQLEENDTVGYWWPPTYSNWLLLTVFSSTRSSIILCNCGFYTFGVVEALHSFQVEIGGHPPNPTGLF
jgi:hypothetical protein